MVKDDFSKHRKIVFALIALVFFSIETIYITFPLIFHLGDFATGEYVIAWILNWNIHSMLSGNIFHIFNTNIFYPYTNTLAYSDSLFTSSLIALPIFLILHQPMVPSNVTFITSLILLGFCTYLLSYFFTKNFFVSLLSGTLIIFSPTVLDKRVHLQILSIWWVPLSIFFYFLYFRTNQFRYFVLALLSFYLQTINNFMAGYMIVISLTCISFYHMLFQKVNITKIISPKNLFAVLVTFSLFVPIIVPYYSVSNEFHFVRDIREAIHLSLQPEDLVVGNETTRLEPLLSVIQNSSYYNSNAEIKPGYLGLIFTILVGITTLYWILKRKSSPKYIGLFLLIGFIGLILSLGPALHLGRKTIHYPFIIPLPYTIFYFIVPGFQGFRNTARFEMLFVIGMAIAESLFLKEILKSTKKLISIGVPLTLLLLVIAEYNFPLSFPKTQTFQQFPKVYSWINYHTSPYAVILETPVYNWDNNPYGDNREVLREYYSTLHFRQLISGGSGFSPPQWQKFADDMFANFPSNQTIITIKKIGVNYLIVHKDEFDILHTEGYSHRSPLVPSGGSVIKELSGYSSLQLLTIVDNAYVYKIK